MDIGSVCLLGGSGFVGRSIADHATERGIRVRVLTRNAARSRTLTVLPTVELMARRSFPTSRRSPPRSRAWMPP